MKVWRNGQEGKWNARCFHSNQFEDNIVIEEHQRVRAWHGDYRTITSSYIMSFHQNLRSCVSSWRLMTELNELHELWMSLYVYWLNYVTRISIWYFRFYSALLYIKLLFHQFIFFSVKHFQTNMVLENIAAPLILKSSDTPPREFSRFLSY